MKLLLLLSVLLASGCVSNSFRGLLEEKDVDLIRPKLTIQSPWGMQVLEAESLRTRVSGTNSLSQPLPPLTNSTPESIKRPAGDSVFLVPLELGVSVRQPK